MISKEIQQENHGAVYAPIQWVVIALCVGMIVGSLLNWVSIEVLRYSVAILLLTQVWLETRTSRKHFLTSPLFLLSFISAFFYSFIHGIASYYWKVPPFQYMSFMESSVEQYIVVFALAGLFVHASAVYGINKMPNEKQFSSAASSAHLAKLFLVSIVILTILNGILFYFPVFQVSSFFQSIRYLVSPLQAFMILYLVRHGIGKEWRFKAVAASVFLISISGMFFVHEGKIPIFIVTAACLYAIRLADISIKKMVLGAMVFVLFGTGAFSVMQAIRKPADFFVNTESKTYSRTDRFLKVVESKMVWRQIETGFCFNNVVRLHGNQEFLLTEQLFWLKGLVPRVVWPDKPSLSLGSSYTSRYCNFESPGHSASITLLGQPVIKGGRVGLIFHGGLLIAGLGGLVLLGRNRRSLSALTIAALLPWLIDFDQDFGMYIANGVKFFIVMLPLVFVASSFERNRAGLGKLF